MIALLSAQEEKKLKREREKLAMRASIYESQGIPITLDEEEDALEGIVGSFRGPQIHARNTPTRGRSSGSTSTSADSSRPQNCSINGYFVHINTPGAQPSLEASPYFLNFVTGCMVVGKGYKPPTPAALSGRLLKDAVFRGKDVLEEQKLQWKQYGCTILLDGWMDGRNRTINNFLVSCKDQVVFLKSLDALDKIKTAETLALMLENVVMEVGADNMVQINPIMQ